jgi:hypothetical protein
LFVAAAVAGFIQAWIVSAYVFAAVMGQWEQFSDFFGVEPPASGPDQFCFDYCVADLPFFAGWVGIGSFLIGLALVVVAWWKPRI